MNKLLYININLGEKELGKEFCYKINKDQVKRLQCLDPNELAKEIIRIIGELINGKPEDYFENIGKNFKVESSIHTFH